MKKATNMVSASTREIVHVVAKYPPALGGMGKVVQTLARHQNMLGMKVSVLTSDQGRTETPYEEEEFSVTRLRSVSVAHAPIMPGLLYRLFHLDRKSLIHLHIGQAYTPETVWLYTKLRRVSYVAYLHIDALPSGWAGFLLEPYKKLVLQRVLRDAATVVVPTEDYRDLLVSRYRMSPSQVAVVPNGTDHRIVERPKSRNEVETEPRLLFVGRLSYQKNIPLLLQAIAVYRKKYDSQIRLTIVGEGDMRESVESEIARLGLSTTVTLTGALYDAALESAYENSDLFLLTSLNESFGLVFIEAMAKALPIISVNIPAVRNVVVNGTNGILVESDPEPLADAIHSLLSNRELYERISLNNLVKASDLDWDTTVKRISEVYDAC